MTTLQDTPAPAPPREPRRSARRRVLRGLSNVLMVAGVLLLADAGLTVAWQEPVSAVYAKVQQGRLGGELETLSEVVVASPAEQRALAALPDPTRRVAFAARSLDRRSEAGQAVGRMRIPAIGVDQVFVEGTDPGDLHNGPGHYPGTPMPGAPGTVGIAGHRTTYGAPFRNVDDLEGGDRIVVEMPYATVTYRVERTRIVPPTALWVVDRRSFDRLVLTACHPLYSAEQRIVVFAREESVEPARSLR